MLSDSTEPELRRATRLPNSRRGVLITANPHAGAKSAAARTEPVRQALLDSGFDVAVITELAELTAVARQWSADNHLRAVVVAGGDGTCSAACSHVPADVPLLPLPMGTESLLARYVDQGVSPQAVCQAVRHGVAVSLDLGQAGDRQFLIMMSAGFDAEVVRHVHRERTGNITRATYFKPTLRTIRSYQYPPLDVYCCDAGAAQDPVRCRWLFAVNLPPYAMGLRFARAASGCDGLLDVCTFQRGSLWHGLHYLWQVQRGRHEQLADCQILRGRRFRIEVAADEEVAVQVDGDAAGFLPVDVGIRPRGLRLLVDPQVAAKLGFVVP